MRISLPENKKEITLGQYIKYLSLYDSYQLNEIDVYTFNRRVLEIFTPLTYNQTSKVSQIDFENCLQQINKALNESSEFERNFKINNIEFGFIPNLNNISNNEVNILESLDLLSIAEYIDGANAMTNKEDLNKLMCVLFRPVTKKDAFGNYSIAEYNGSKEYKEVMMHMPLSVVDGALFFFLNLSTELQNYILKYTEEERKRVR